MLHLVHAGFNNDDLVPHVIPQDIRAIVNHFDRANFVIVAWPDPRVITIARQVLAVLIEVLVALSVEGDEQRAWTF